MYPIPTNFLLVYNEFFFFFPKTLLSGVFASRSVHCARMGLLSGAVDLLEGAVRYQLAPGISFIQKGLF